MKRFSTPDPTEGDPIPFEIEVVRVEDVKVFPEPDEHGHVGEPRVEKQQRRETKTFYAKPDVSGGVLVGIELMGGQGRKNGRGGDALFDFFDAALLDPADFRALIEAEDVFVKAETIGEIAGWLYQVYSGREPRPTTRT